MKSVLIRLVSAVFLLAFAGGVYAQAVPQLLLNDDLSVPSGRTVTVTLYAPAYDDGTLSENLSPTLLYEDASGATVSIAMTKAQLIQANGATLTLDATYWASVTISLSNDEEIEFSLKSDSAFSVPENAITISGDDGGQDHAPKLNTQAHWEQLLNLPIEPHGRHTNSDGHFRIHHSYYTSVTQRPPQTGGRSLHLVQHMYMSGILTVTATASDGSESPVKVMVTTRYQTTTATVSDSSFTRFRSTAPYVNTQTMRTNFPVQQQTLTIYQNGELLTATVTAGVRYATDNDIVAVVAEAAIEDRTGSPTVTLAHPPANERHMALITNFYAGSADWDGDGVANRIETPAYENNVESILANRFGGYTDETQRSFGVTPLPATLRLGELAVSAANVSPQHNFPPNNSDPNTNQRAITTQISVSPDLIEWLPTVLSDDSAFADPQAKNSDGVHYYAVLVILQHYGTWGTVAVPLTATVSETARYAAFVPTPIHSDEPNWHYIDADGGDPDGQVLWAVSTGSAGGEAITCPPPNRYDNRWSLSPPDNARCALLIIRDGGKYDYDGTMNATADIAGAILDSPIDIEPGVIRASLTEEETLSVVIGRNGDGQAATLNIFEASLNGEPADIASVTTSEGSLFVAIDTGDIAGQSNLNVLLASPSGAKFAQYSVSIELLAPHPGLQPSQKIFLSESGGERLIYDRQLFSTPVSSNQLITSDATPELPAEFSISVRVNTRGNAILEGVNPGLDASSDVSIYTITTRAYASTDSVGAPVSVKETTLQFITRHDTQLSLDEDQTLQTGASIVTIRAQAYGKRKDRLSRITTFAAEAPVVDVDRAGEDGTEGAAEDPVTLRHMGSGIYTATHTLNEPLEADEVIQYKLFDSQQDYIYGKTTMYVSGSNNPASAAEEQAVNIDLAIHALDAGNTTTVAFMPRSHETLTVAASATAPAGIAKDNLALTLFHTNEPNPTATLVGDGFIPDVAGVAGGATISNAYVLPHVLISIGSLNTDEPPPPATGTVSVDFSAEATVSATLNLVPALQRFSLHVGTDATVLTVTLPAGNAQLYYLPGMDGTLTLQSQLLVLSTPLVVEFPTLQPVNFVNVTAAVVNTQRDSTLSSVVSTYVITQGSYAFSSFLPFVADNNNNGIPDQGESLLAINEMRSSTENGVERVMRVSGTGNRLMPGIVSRYIAAITGESPTTPSRLVAFQGDIHSLYEQYLFDPSNIYERYKTMVSLLSDSPPTYSETGIFDFAISLARPGDRVSVAIPLRTPLASADANYWKYRSGGVGWTPLSNQNNVYWTQGDGSDCPAPILRSNLRRLPASVDWWRRTPRIGDDCMLLIIRDGGSGDNDDTANYMIIDPGAVVYGRPPRNRPSGNSGDVTIVSSSSGGGGGSMSLWVLWCLLALLFLRRLSANRLPMRCVLPGRGFGDVNADSCRSNKLTSAR